MARGKDTRNDTSRIVDITAWKRRNHPSVQAGGGGKKPPKTPSLRTGGSSDDFTSRYSVTNRYSEDPDPTPYQGTERPSLPYGMESQSNVYPINAGNNKVHKKVKNPTTFTQYPSGSDSDPTPPHGIKRPDTSGYKD